MVSNRPAERDFVTDVAVPVATIGVLLLLGLVADTLARRTPLPRVTLLMFLGLLAGPAAFDLLPPGQDTWFTVAASVALVMIGFLLGGEFTYRHVKELEGPVLRTALTEAITTAAVVAVGLLLLGASVEVALPLAGIAAATAPAATLAVIDEAGAEGAFVDVLKGVVAVDDVIGIVLFSLLVAVTGVLAEGSLQWDAIVEGFREIGGSVALGLALGVPAAPLTGRIRGGEATLEEALGLVLLCAGMAMHLELSPVLAAMVMGATLANLATHHERPFHEIDNIEWPFLVIFFFLAGASLELHVLRSAGLLVAGYVLFRALGKGVGPWLAGRLTGADQDKTRWLGLALFPQAGVALGLALAAALRFPDAGATVLNVVVAGTVVFELLGPVLTRLALRLEGADAS